MSKKRGNGEGTITQDKRDGRWHGQLTLPNGRRKNVYGKTRKDVHAKLAQLRREIDAGLHTNTAIAGRNTPFVTYCNEWFELHRHGIAENTQLLYGAMIRNHITTYFTDITVGAMTPVMINNACRDMFRAGYTHSTVKTFRNVIHMALGAAEREELILRNPATKTQLPKQSKDAGDSIHIFTHAELYQMIEAARGTLIEYLVPFGFFTGMRRGEIMGACWGDIDWGRQQIHVHRQIQIINRRPQYTRLKTTMSNRLIPLLPQVIEALRAQHHIVEQMRAVAGDTWDSTYDCIFPDAFGRPLTGARIQYAFKKLVRSCGLSAHTLHDMRHTFATMLLETKVSATVVAALLGHTDPSVTLGTYAHLLPDSMQKAAEMLQQVFLIEGRIVDENHP